MLPGPGSGVSLRHENPLSGEVYRGLNPANGARSLLPGGYPQRRVRGAFNPAASCADPPARCSPAAAKSVCKFGTASARCQVTSDQVGEARCLSTDLS
jgi:hypothetical protein